MFSSWKTIATCLSLAGGIFASPLVERRTDVVQYAPRTLSLNQFNGINSFGNFDDFFGIDNFDGRNNFQNIIVQQNLVCSAVDIIIVQQQLAIMLEVTKKIILTQICDVELQVIALQQFHAGGGIFLDDILRRSGRNIGFDNAIAGRFNQVFLDDGRFNNIDHGFRGFDIGANLFAPVGFNWNDATSPASVEFALQAAERARLRHE